MAKKKSSPTKVQTNAGVNPMGAPAKPAAVSSIAAAGPVLSKSEARSIADAKGKTVAQVMAKAQDKGVALGSGLVNQFNSGKAGPNLSNLNTSIGNTPIPIGVNNRAAQALTQLQALQGLRMNPGTAYAGYSTTTTPARDTSTVNGGATYTPASTTYNPIVLPRNTATGGVSGGAGGAAAGGGRGDTMCQEPPRRCTHTHWIAGTCGGR